MYFKGIKSPPINRKCRRMDRWRNDDDVPPVRDTCTDWWNTAVILLLLFLTRLIAAALTPCHHHLTWLLYVTTAMHVHSLQISWSSNYSYDMGITWDNWLLFIRSIQIVYLGKSFNYIFSFVETIVTVDN